MVLKILVTNNAILDFKTELCSIDINHKDLKITNKDLYFLKFYFWKI